MASSSLAKQRLQLDLMEGLPIALWFSGDLRKTAIGYKSTQILELIEELKQCPFVEICWYFTDSWEQFRINGSVEVIDGLNLDPMKLQLREKSWYASSIKSRMQYLGPNPGLPCLSEQPSCEISLDPSSSPVAPFCLLVLDPEQVDYLNLKSNQRIMFTLMQSVNGEYCWNSEKINL